MTAKTQPGRLPNFLRQSHYSGTISTVLYNWPIFLGIAIFGTAAIVSGVLLTGWWQWMFIIAGASALLMGTNILLASYWVYDHGQQKEYDRLAELVDLSKINVVLDITCGKQRGTVGLLRHIRQGHYFVIDIYDPAKMPDAALRRARELNPPLEADRRIYQRTAPPNKLPMPHNWADVIYCNFSLHELRASEDRDHIFAEFARVLKPNGTLLIAEHGRDWRHLLAFGPGALSFFPVATWQQHLQEAGLQIEHHQRWRGLVHLWVAKRPAR